MYYQDLSKYVGPLNKNMDDILNVGWLSASEEFPKGKVPKLAIDKLLAVMEARQDVRQMRGIYPCPICGKSKIMLQTSTRPILLGMSEIWIPAGAGKIYASPSLIIHFIMEHQYQPPQIYIDDLLEFELKPDWNAEQEFKSILG